MSERGLPPSRRRETLLEWPPSDHTGPTAMPFHELLATAARWLVLVPLTSSALAEQGAAGGERAPVENGQMTWGAEGGASSGYVWRGLVISDAPVTEASAWMHASGFTFLAWQNLARSDTSDGTRPEIAYVFVGYEHDWRGFTLEPSLESFRYRDPLSAETARSTEAAVKLSYSAGPLLLFASYGVDISAHDGASYLETGVAHERWLRDEAHFEVALRSGFASAKFNEANVGIAKRAVNFVGIDGSLTYHVRPHFYVRPHLEISAVVDADVRRMVSDARPLTFGIAVGGEF